MFHLRNNNIPHVHQLLWYYHHRRRCCFRNLGVTSLLATLLLVSLVPICIAPGTPHCVENTGAAPLKILCACAPAYAHGDTELIGPAGGNA